MTKKKTAPVETPEVPELTEEQKALLAKVHNDEVFKQLVEVHKSFNTGVGTVLDIVFAQKLRMDALEEKLNG
jgi:hypothetical protein